MYINKKQFHKLVNYNVNNRKHFAKNLSNKIFLQIYVKIPHF